MPGGDGCVQGFDAGGRDAECGRAIAEILADAAALAADHDRAARLEIRIGDQQAGARHRRVEDSSFFFEHG